MRILGRGKRSEREVPRDTAALALEWTRRLWAAKLWRGNDWLGVPILQWPTDLQVLQEILHRHKPRIILETGTNAGGSAVFFASMLGLVHGDPAAGKVITVDIKIPDSVRAVLREHPQGGERIIAIEGDSKSSQTIAAVREAVGDESEVLVFLDSDHSYEHVLAEMRAYCDLVPADGWLIVFDTICRWLADLDSAPDSWATDNPHRAVETFLDGTKDFVRDPGPEKLLVTFGAGGFLRKTKG